MVSRIANKYETYLKDFPFLKELIPNGISLRDITSIDVMKIDRQFLLSIPKHHEDDNTSSSLYEEVSIIDIHGKVHKGAVKQETLICVGGKLTTKQEGQEIFESVEYFIPDDIACIVLYRSLIKSGRRPIKDITLEVRKPPTKISLESLIERISFQKDLEQSVSIPIT